ncbi:hypothetical protein P7K49_038800 [Saguinus oedipus]|uniref:PurM-like N-terminal domain-containing protein n=1 Tax=Saguinus oedipus TaxID=9490 RepID=A0ABQ9TFR0_SAGOE|nr:hypothetical protein P7K49_038800 [Saguinus oedipus]
MSLTLRHGGSLSDGRLRRRHGGDGGDGSCGRLFGPGELDSGLEVLQLPALQAPGIGPQPELAADGLLWHEGLRLQDPAGDTAQTPGGTDAAGRTVPTGPGPGIGMNSCVIPLRHGGLSLVQTTDFFYPLVEDPYMMGGIACANVLSDLYAMGLTECDNMLMLLASARV